jgi:hypothetical protein
VLKPSRQDKEQRFGDLDSKKVLSPKPIFGHKIEKILGYSKSWLPKRQKK